MAALLPMTVSAFSVLAQAGQYYAQAQRGYYV
jgi:hypothetical protein